MEKKITISPTGTMIGRAVALEGFYRNVFIRIIFFCIWLLGPVSLLSILANYTFYPLPDYIGAALILAGIFLFYLAGRSFFYRKIIKPRVSTPNKIKVAIAAGELANFFSVFSFGLAKATAKLFRQYKNESTTTKELLLAVLEAQDANFILLRLGLSPNILKQALKGYGGKPEILPVLTRAVEIADVNGQQEVTSGAVLAALAENDEFAKRITDDIKIDSKDIANLAYWQAKIFKEVEDDADLLNPDHFRLTGGFGKDWAFGYTNFLRSFSVDITQSIKSSGLGLEVIGRESEIKQIEEALLHQTNGNVLVVGAAGIGKRTTILGFAKKVLEGNAPPAFAHDHIFQVNTDALLSGISDPGELVAAIRRVLDEAAYAGNVLIFIENIQNLLSDGGAGQANASEVIIPYLERGGVHIIATCDVESYNKVILNNSALTEHFTRVSIEEPDKDEMIRILEDSVPQIEYKNNALISYEAIKETIKAADKFILNLPNPEKSIDLLDAATTKAATERGQTIILPKDINEYITEKYAVPTVELGENEKKVLLDLEYEIHNTVVGQNEAVKAVSDAMKRSRAQVEDSPKPIGSFLFLGPTGVGKTALAKALARAYFGKEIEMTRFDMSEYQNEADIYRLIGTPDGESGLLVTQVREKPFSLLLFDEIEKANPNILNLFLQILDEGNLTDVTGKKVSFRNTIIIATSNAGANVIREAIKQGIPYEKVKSSLVDYLIKDNLFRPELLNRFTGVIAFSPLTLPEINSVAKVMIEKLAKDTAQNKGITLTVADDAISQLAGEGFDPEMGARPMERVIQEKIENLLAEKILKNELKKGDDFVVTREMIG